MVINELASAYLTSTVAFGFAGNYAGGAIPYSFASAMGDVTSWATVGLKCNPYTDKTLCNFDHIHPPSTDGELPPSFDFIEEEIESFEPLSLADPNVTHSVCNMKTGKCEDCDPGSSGMGCVATDTCQSDCKV